MNSNLADSILVIGDPHFAVKHYLEGEELIEKCVEIAELTEPSNIIILGDILDTHEVARNAPYKQALKFIEKLSDIAHVYLLIGNHDLINQKQYLSDNHFFTPLKKWGTVTVVDEPIRTQFAGKDIVMTPYVPCGKLEEALDTLVYEEYDWRYDCDCVFGHQEIKGVVYGGKVSEKGDMWDEEYPPLICGHIHAPSQVGRNVFYPGSSRQVAIDEDPNKKIWSITFDDEAENKLDALEIDKIDLELKGKKEVLVDIEDVHEFDFSLTDKYYIKLKIKGTSEQFKVFRKSEFHAKLIREGIKIGFDPIKRDIDEDIIDSCMVKGTGGSFEQIMDKLVETRSENIKKAYKDLKRPEIVFVED